MCMLPRDPQKSQGKLSRIEYFTLYQILHPYTLLRVCVDWGQAAIVGHSPHQARVQGLFERHYGEKSFSANLVRLKVRILKGMACSSRFVQWTCYAATYCAHYLSA